MPGVRPVLAHVLLSVVESFYSLALPHPGQEVPSEDVPSAGPEDSPAVFEAAAEASGIVVTVVVDGGPLATLQWTQDFKF